MKNPILENTLFTDNANEALREVINDGYSEHSMLVCEAKDKDGEIYQIHIRAIRIGHADFIPNHEELEMFDIDDECNLTEYNGN